jgi:anhydro-N-acetylmuramic acid kinase
LGGCDVPVAVPKLGRVTNLIYVGPGGELTAFDCGTANALIDDWMSQKTSFDFHVGWYAGKAPETAWKV